MTVDEAFGVTIDGPQSTDLDDAIWVTRTSRGVWRVMTAIADVPALVRPGSGMDVRAREQGVTYYHAEGKTSPMLPRAIERSASLLPGEARQAIVIEFTVTADAPDRAGLLSDVTVRRDPFRSMARFTHAQAAKAAANPSNTTALMLREALECASALMSARRRFGGLVIFDHESGWATSEDGLPVRSRSSNAGHLIVQELMIATNVSVAMIAAQAGLPILYRNHRANAAAPAAASFTADLDLAESSGGKIDKGTIVERIGLIAGRAVYEPVVGGHWALNLPAYTHATSPIRRYADVVTWRVLLRHLGLSDDPAPTEIEAAEIGEHLNQVTVDAQQRKHSSYLERWHNAVDRSVDQHGLDGVGPNEFHTLLKAAVADDDGDDSVPTEAARRARSGCLPVKDMWLTGSAPGDRWASARAAVVAQMCENTHQVISVLAIAEQTAGWQFRVVASVPHPDGGFNAEVSVLPPGSTGPYVGSDSALTVKGAEQRAAVRAFAAATGVTDVPLLDAPSKGATAGGVGRPPKQVLYELCQSQRWDPPQFSSQRPGGADHQPSFIATVVVTTPSGDIEATSEPRASKQEAEHNAAAKITPMLNSAVTAAPPVASAVAGNAKGRLNEWSQVNRTTPTFVTTPDRSGFSSEVTVRVAGQGNVIGHGSGGTKKDAEQAAAGDALEQIDRANRSVSA